MLKFVCISDTHSLHSKVALPDGDVLIHSGDFTGSLANQERDLVKVNAWLGTLPHRVKILVPGNHDKLLQTDPGHARALLSNATVLIDEEVTVDGIRIYGSPWTPTFLNWYFMQSRGAAIAKKWARIPAGIDVLVTHGPPYGILDTVERYSPGAGEWVEDHVGCEELLKRVAAVEPKVHVFGHMHGSYGEMPVGKTYFINAAVCDEAYQPVNKPKVFEIERKQS